MSGAKVEAVHRVSRAQRVANVMLGRMLRRGRGPAFMQLLTVRGRRTGRLRNCDSARNDSEQHGYEDWMSHRFSMSALIDATPQAAVCATCFTWRRISNANLHIARAHDAGLGSLGT